MKRIFTLLLAILMTTLAFSQTTGYIVKGTVKYTNGNVVANKLVKIWVDSLAGSGSCYQVHYKNTNSAGQYIDTVFCNTPIQVIKTSTENCNGTILTNTHQLIPTTQLVESNFTICLPVIQCVANYTFGVQNLSVNFNSTSVASSGTSIVEHIWKFGDGTSQSTGTSGTVSHTYPSSGVYNATLIIRTGSAGSIACSDSVIKSIVVYDSTQTGCQAYFTHNSNGLAIGTVQFVNNSTPTSGQASYLWTFGNGMTSTLANPIVTFPASGTYNVCLKIQTANGCRDSICKPITISLSNTCVSNFNFNVLQGTTYQFNSTASSASTPTDAIVKRVWVWGDGTRDSGNIVSPVHTFPAPGVYTVCLTITTSAGCVKTECKVVNIVNTSCFAFFQILPVTSNPFGRTFNSSQSGAGSINDSIISRRWNFGNGDTLGGNVVSPVRTYTSPGTYTVCLRIQTASGCVKEVCSTFVIQTPPPPTCNAAFTFQALSVTAGTNGWPVKFNSAGSTASSSADSIRERIWVWGDGTPNSTGVDPTHVYLMNGTYNVCLIIRTLSGCSDTTCASITVPFQNQLNCIANFVYTPQGQLVRFNASQSITIPGDSIIQYKWEFGNGVVQTGMLREVSYQYPQPGLYNVCLTIRTLRGCERKICKQVVVPQTTPVQCVPHFTYLKTGAKQITFNSTMSWVPANDSIIERNWKFGDGTTLGGNIVSPIKNYPNLGVYTACLRIRTAKGCVNEVCAPVRVYDSLNIPPPPNAGPIRIINTYPNPCTTQFNAVVWSQNNNVQVELAIYDVYGVKKWSVNKVLLQGNNYTAIPTGFLPSGPYFFRVTSMYGVQSKPFYKL